jgi:hypothetical protein
VADKPSDRVTVYVGGDGITPTTVEPHVALELAGAYFDLMQKVAEDRDQNLVLRGLEVVEGSAGLASRTSDPKLAATAANEVDELLAGSSEPTSTKVERAYSRLARVVEALPQGHWARAAVGSERPRQLVPVRPPAAETEIWTTTTLRASPFKVGGRLPKVWFKSGSEPRPFGVATDEKTAQEVAHHLYGEVEVTFRFVRDDDGSISDGVLVSFRPVTASPDEVAQWREWFREAGAHWADVDDVDRALGRGEGDE